MILIQASHEPHNMGPLLWQLSGRWPVTSWNSTEYFNRRPKAAWYPVKEAYRDDVRPAIHNVRPQYLRLNDPAITWEINGDTIILLSTAQLYSSLHKV